MNPLVVRYRARPDSADENQSLVEAVFEQLHERAPEGLRYACLRLDDDTFIHVANLTATANPLLDLESFAAFSATVASRCEPGTQPVARTARLVGDYRLFG